jgi:hypothetical protein
MGFLEGGRSKVSSQNINASFHFLFFLRVPPKKPSVSKGAMKEMPATKDSKQLAGSKRFTRWSHGSKVQAVQSKPPPKKAPKKLKPFKSAPKLDGSDGGKKKAKAKAKLAKKKVAKAPGKGKRVVTKPILDSDDE